VKSLPFIVRFAIADPLIGPIHQLDFARGVVRQIWNGSNHYSAFLRVKEKVERAAEEKPLGGVSRACC
jgi:hypothetical protein